jgi:hypothetical protein
MIIGRSKIYKVGTNKLPFNTKKQSSTNVGNKNLTNNFVSTLLTLPKET